MTRKSTNKKLFADIDTSKMPTFADIPFDANEEYLNTGDVMRMLKLSRSTIGRYCELNILPHLKIGNTTMFPKLLMMKVFYNQCINNRPKY